LGGEKWRAGAQKQRETHKDRGKVTMEGL